MKVEKLADTKEYSLYWESKYFQTYANECRRKDFCSYILDYNDTIKPPTWSEQATNSTRSRKKKFALGQFQDLIVVNLKFATPKARIIVLDARLSLYDKIAGLGGTFGLFTQLTGGSFLTLLHLMALLIKATYNYFFKV